MIVVGPKDLPGMFRSLGQFTGRLRKMAREFSRAMDDAADQTGAREMARDLRSMTNPRSAATKGFKKAVGLDDIEKDFDLSSDDVEDEGARDTTAKSYGAHTRELAEKRAAEARARREDAVKRANERSASFNGFDSPEKSPAPQPGEAAPAPPAASPASESAVASADAPQDKA